MAKLSVILSPEGQKVAGGLMAQAPDMGGARRVAVEVAAWFCDATGIAMPAPAAASSVVLDAVGDLDWQATASAAGWLSAEDVGSLLGEVEQARAAVAQAEASADESERLRVTTMHERTAAATEAAALRAECERLRSQLVGAEAEQGRLQMLVDKGLTEIKRLTAELQAAGMIGKVDTGEQRDPAAAVPPPLPAAASKVPAAAAPIPATVQVPAAAGDVPPVPVDASGRPVVAPDMWSRMAPALRASIVAREAARGAK